MADNNDKEARRRKHQKKMTKIISKAWELGEQFQESHHQSNAKAVYDLTTMGQHLDEGVYTYDRAGWEHFSRDIGGVYNRHILKKGKRAKVAKEHLTQVLQWLEKVNPGLAKVASDYSPSTAHHHHGKKRRADQSNGAGPRKKHAPERKSDKPLTLSEREDKAMESLGNYVEDHGGDRSQVSSFRCKTSKRANGKCENNFFNSEGKRFRNMVDVARFLGLISETKSAPAKKKKPKKQMTSREVENEKRKLRRELDKLHKAHLKATKALDDFQTERKESRYPIDDEVLMEEEAEKGVPTAITPATCQAARVPDIDGFPGIPAYCVPDLLMVWDFLCTYSRALSLNPMPLDDFVSALTYMPHGGDPKVVEISPPVLLAEAHLGLLRLILNDAVSEEWWWSTLETDEAAPAEGEFGDVAASSAKGGSDMPVIKVDMEALLSAEEDPLITSSWLQALEAVRNQRSSDGEQIHIAVRTAQSVVSNKWVKAYLKIAARKGKRNNASFTKRAILWLVDRVRDARPDLFERNVSKEMLQQRRAKVVDESAIAMEKLHDSIEAVTTEDVEGDSDEESDDSDDEDDPDGEDAKANESGARSDSNSQDESKMPVRSAVPVNPPPSVVDLLLPPSKPKPSSDIVSPLTWPFIVGASACRVLHRYKRRRNEVDDNMRDFRELPPMSMAERRSREAVAPMRILTECVAKVGESCPLEKAIDHLCSGGTYMALSSIERLCLFRLLVEAAYDTNRVFDVVNENFTSRINALKALEMEERRAKREAREEASAEAAAARAQLAAEAKAEFIQQKREEINSTNVKTNDYTTEVLSALTDEEIAEFDEEIKAEYDALPGPESFNRTQVTKMVARMQEEAAFNTHSLLVLTMDEIKSRDTEDLEAMENELASYGDSLENQMIDRETSKHIDRLRRDIDNTKSMAESLPDARESAVETLKEAIEDGTLKVLRAAIRIAKQAKLTGPDHATGGLWALDLLRDAALELRTAESRKRVTDAQKDLVAKRNKCFIRTEPIGRDRFRNRFWHFNGDLMGRVWAEVDFTLQDDADRDRDVGVREGYVNLTLDKEAIRICEEDRADDLLENEPVTASDSLASRVRFNCQEYHASGSIPALAKRFWGGHITEASFRAMIKHLEKRGTRENELRTNLKTTLEDSGLAAGSEKAEGSDDTSEEYHTKGDEEVFGVAKDALPQSSIVDHSLLEGMSSAMGKRVRVREVLDPNKVPVLARYIMATVVGWKMHTEVDDEDDKDEEVESSTEAPAAPSVPVPMWRVLYDSGEDFLINGIELVESLCRAVVWKNEHAGYKEDDGAFLAYRNSLGRFCGRAADAAQASSPMALARLMIKREQELYTRIKNRTFDNNWGGKSGARNVWITTMKDYCFDISSVRNGLVTLEGAFFELTGGFAAVEGSIGETVETSRSARELLSDKDARFEIELESLVKQAQCLWNSRESRSIFLEIVESSTTAGILALAFDLLCRNCWVYLNANTVADERKPAAATTGTRRMNAWQQANQSSLYY